MVEQKLHPGAKWLFRLSAFWTIIFLSFFLGFWIFPIIVAVVADINVVSSIVIFGIIWIVVSVILIEVYARLSYKFWGYEFAKDQLRIQRGIIWKRYSNIPYSRVQNVDITRGIIARLCGFSTVNIQTAGYSMPAGNSYGRFTEGYIPAVSVEEAEKIREFVVKKSSNKRSGL